MVAQTLKGVSTTFAYDRNRLLTATAAGSTASYTYDPFGRLSQVSAAGKVIERNTYDGYDRIIKHRQLQDDGSTKTTDTSYDALDRTSSKVEGTKTTNYSYLGLSGEVLSEEVAGKVTSSYQYSPWGSRLSQVKFKADGTSEDSYYGYNPHSDVETLTTDGGDTRSTYGYTAYGKNDEDRFTGVDKPEAQNPGKEPYNVYRFNAKRWDQSSQSYDMGFRDYSPGLNRFLTRDNYNGALADMSLSTDPWNGNRYAFAGGNPISRVEVDGHYAIDEEGNRVPTYSAHDAAIIASVEPAETLMKKMDFEGEVSTDIGVGGAKRNKVVGGAKDGSGADGIADMIIWGKGKDAGTIFVYEVKPANEYGLTGIAQLQRYVDKLQAMYPDALVEAGPDLDSADFVSREGPGRVWSGKQKTNDPPRNDLKGMRWYGVDRPRPSPTRTPAKPPRNNQNEQPERQPNGLPQVDQDALAKGTAAAGIAALLGYALWRGTPWGMAEG